MSRIAWFTPLPPISSGVARYSAELIPRLTTHDIHVFVDGSPRAVEPPADRVEVHSAHDFVWLHARERFDLVVYQLGNARCHDYMWGYLAHYPGLVVLHDGQLHHARALSLRAQHREDDYREEFRLNHPGVPPDAAELAIAGWLGSLTYLWPMRRIVIDSARAVLVHNRWLADEIREEHPSASVHVVEMGVPAFITARGAPPPLAPSRLGSRPSALRATRSASGVTAGPASTRLATLRSRPSALRATRSASGVTAGPASTRLVTLRSRPSALRATRSASGVRCGAPSSAIRARHGIPEDAVVFLVLGTATPEKRIRQVIRALAGVVPHADVRLLIVGQNVEHYDPRSDALAHGIADRVIVTGFVPHEDLEEYLSAADVCLCLRWPTSRETSAVWLRCLAAGRATIVTDLAHMVDVPTLDPRNWKMAHAPAAIERESLDPSRADPVAVSIDILDEDHSLLLACRRLAQGRSLRETLGTNARALWQARFTLDRMAAGYERVLAAALDTPLPSATRLAGVPPHMRPDGAEWAASLLRTMHVSEPRIRTLWRTDVQ